MMERAYIDYYSQNKISPVSQDITDLEKHFRRRGALYRSLGITPGNVGGRKVLEFGPGSGHNSIYTSSLKPAKYVLVDGNPTGLHETERLLRKFNAVNIRFELSLIEEYEDEDAYDLVLGEGFLSLQKFPTQILGKMVSFVRPSGILVTTAQDSVSSISDIVRTAIGRALRQPGIPLREQAERLIPVFRPHFEKLHGMSKLPVDWILDQALHPIVCKKPFSFGDILGYLNDSFVFLGSSPDFVTDWRWYKDCVDDDLVNANAIASYKRNCHNLLDFRHVYPERDSDENDALTQIADRLFESCLAVEGREDTAALDAIRAELERMAENIEPLAMHGGGGGDSKSASRRGKRLQKLEERPRENGFWNIRRLLGTGTAVCVVCETIIPCVIAREKKWHMLIS